MTIRQLLTLGSQRLLEAGVTEGELDARYLLQEEAKLSAAILLTKMDQEAGDALKERYLEQIEKRANRIPLQHIIGNQEFMGLEFLVSSDVLIPRQDTETLVERVLADEASKSGGRLLDLCTGSGCIAISLGVLGNFSEIVASDISRAALEVAKANEKRLLGEEKLQEKGLKVTLMESDLLEAIKGEPFDDIVSNPPYIPSSVIEGLEPEVRDHEPRLALDGEADGLSFYRRIARESGRYLKPGGRLYLEIGWDQGRAVSSLLAEAGFAEIEVIKDIPGQDRVVAAVWPREGTHV